MKIGAASIQLHKKPGVYHFWVDKRSIQNIQIPYCFYRYKMQKTKFTGIKEVSIFPIKFKQELRISRQLKNYVST